MLNDGFQYKLTEDIIRNLPIKDKPSKIGDGRRLFLLVKSETQKYFRYYYWFDNKKWTLALGVWPTVSLLQAREKAAYASLILSHGIDPKTAKHERKKQCDVLPILYSQVKFLETTLSQLKLAIQDLEKVYRK